MKLNFTKIVLLVCLLVAAVEVCGQSVATDYFRSTVTGNWALANSWESSADGSSNWITATLAPTEAANSITIRNGHTITVNTNITADQVVIASGGVLDLATTSSTFLTVNDGTGSDITVQSGGTFKHNITSAQLPSFNASAILEIQTSGILEVAGSNGNPSDYAVTGSAVASHVIWNDGSIFNWNNTADPSNGVTYFPATSAIPIFRVSKAISIGNTVPTVINGLLEANATVGLSSTGTKTFRNGIIGTGTVTATAISGGQFIINGSTAKLGGGTLVLNNNGLAIASGTVATMSTNKTINNYSGSTGNTTVTGTLVCDDLLIDGNGKIQIDGTLKTTNVNGLTGGLNTTFVNGFTVATPGTSSTIDYNRSGDQTVTPLTYGNLSISGTGLKKITAAADVSVTGILNILAANTFVLNGVDDLKLNGGGTLTINANASFDNGGESQITGGGSPTVNIYGTFISRDAQGFTGTNTSIPGATSTPTISVNIYAGSVIEYGRLGDQQVSSRSDYKSMTFSGSGTKTLATFRPIGTVTIKDNAVVDAANKTFGDTTATNLTMTGGRFVVAGNSTKPDIAGTYNLTGGIIEFAGGTLSTRQNIRSTPTYLNLEITGVNVGNSNSSTKLADGGSFTIKNKGSYENSGNKIDGTTGIQTFTMEAGATFKTGVTAGFSGTGSEAVSNIETITIDPKSTIIYSRTTNQTITQLASGYPTLLLQGGGIKTVTTGTLTIAATADSVVIDPSVVLKVSSGAKANFNNRPVVVRSSTSGTGYIGEITDGSSALSNATNVTIERYIPARRAYRFLSSPVTTTNSIKDNWMEGQSNPPPAYSVNYNNLPGYGTHITGSSDANNGFDATATNNSSLFTFNNSAQLWEPLLTTDVAMAAGFGYRLFVRGNRTVDLSNNSATPSNTILRTKGSLKAGSVTYNSNSFPSINSNIDYYSLVGNPYASPVDWDASTKTGLSPYYYAWDPNINTRGAYVAYGNGITSIQTSQVNQNIQSGQAFFVQTKSANPSLTFNETNKTTISRSVYRSGSAIPNLSVQLLLDTTGETQHTADGISIFFDDTFINGIGAEDAEKINNLDETMSIRNNNKSFSMEGRNNVLSFDTVQLDIVRYRQKSYYLKFDPNNFSSTLTAICKDKFSKKETAVDLSSTTLLPFNITTDSSSLVPDRFSIIFKSNKVYPLLISDIKAYKKEPGIQVEWFTSTEEGIQRYEVEKSIDGQSFEKRAVVDLKEDPSIEKKYLWYDEVVNNGNNYYRIKCILMTGGNFYSNLVRINIKGHFNSISIFPNPIIGNSFNVKIQNLKKSVYSVSLINNNGQLVYTGILDYKGTTQTFKVAPGNVIPKGVYKIKISDSEQTFIENILFE
ncbi:MAG: C-terminal target protein [Segetibacter sp.]|nr:C-terminal target protein [Segetibacter sp.]